MLCWPVPVECCALSLPLILLLSAIFGCQSQFVPALSNTHQDSSAAAASSPLLMNLISPQNINQLTQFATGLAAQAMKSNGQMIANSGPEVKPIPTNARPSEMFGQGLTNMLQPTRQLASLTLGAAPPSDHDDKTAVEDSAAKRHYRPAAADNAVPAEHRALIDLANTFFGGGSNGVAQQHQRRQSRVTAADDDSDNDAHSLLSYGGGGVNNANGGSLNAGGATNNMIGQAMRMLSGGIDASSSSSAQHLKRRQSSTGNDVPLGDNDNGGGAAANNMIGQAMRMLSGGIDDASSSAYGQQQQYPRRQQSSTGNAVMPSLRQLFPGAERNFGIRQGEGCLPFLDEFMKMALGSCVKRADEKTWDAWGKEINIALSGGKIDLLRASKETCKMGAEREQCGQLRKAISDCNILGSIQLASNMQRSVSRCDEISGLMDQNPGTIMSQMNGLINGEVAQGLLNNFLG